MIAIDRQNDFCAKGGWGDHLGASYMPDRRPIEPLRKLLPALRQTGVPIIWVKRENRPNLANMPPNQIHLYKPTGTGIGLCDNVKRCFGFFTDSRTLLKAIGEMLPGIGMHA